MLVTVGTILAVAGCTVILWIAIRAAPRARVLRPMTPRRARELALKERLLLERILRTFRSWGSATTRAQDARAREWGQQLRRGYQRLRLRAQEYATAKPEHIPSTCAAALTEAHTALEAGEYERAEERFLACLKLDAKYRDAYIGLSALYRARREDALAGETLRFLRKLYPDDAEVAYLAADLALATGNAAHALREMQAALNVQPKNPKYLDFGIACAIVARKTDTARRWLAQLREVNPENQKIAEFEERVHELES